MVGLIVSSTELFNENEDVEKSEGGLSETLKKFLDNNQRLLLILKNKKEKNNGR
jgi:hypothetical protein